MIDLQNVPPKPEGSEIARPGVHVVAPDSFEILPFMLMDLAHRLAGGKKIAGVKFPAMPSALLTSGNDYEHEQMQALARAFDLEATEQHRTLQQIAGQPLNLLHHETVALLRAHMQEQQHAVVPLQSADRFFGELAANIALLDDAAAEANVYMMLVLPMINGKYHPHFTAISSPVIRVTQAEPDPDFMLAWVLSRDDVRQGHFFGRGRRMVQIKSREKRLTVDERSFISTDRKRRVMALCRSSGLSVTETAMVVDMNKSSVSRADSSLPPIPPKAIPKAWWGPYEEAYHFDKSVIEKMTTFLA